MKILLRLLPALFTILATLRAAESAGLRSLGFTILPTVQYAHTDIWFHTPSEQPPSLATVDEIAPRQRLDLVVLVNGFGVDAESKAHVTYDLVIHFPNGKTQAPPGSIVVIDQLKVDPRILLFPRGIVSFSSDPGDPPGEYRFEVTVRDHVSGTTATKSATVRVGETNAPLPQPKNGDALALLSDYYQHPRPRLALPTLTAFSHTPYALKKADAHGALLGFYEQVLADNPWLLPQFRERLATTTDLDERRAFALVLAYTQRNDPKFGDDLTGAASAALGAARKEPMPFPSAEPTAGGQLDLLWGRFFASGRFEPIADLAAIVQRYAPYRGKLEEFKRRSPMSKNVPPEATKDVILGSALWSLGSNAHQHPLVRSYLLALIQTGDRTPEAKAALQATLDWTPRSPASPSPRP